ncbi:MAG: hypothetical protein AAFX79_02715 [Planctomycetota bacterium]
MERTPDQHEHEGLAGARSSEGDPPTDGVDDQFSAIERELQSLVQRCEQATSRQAAEMEQRQAELDRTLQIALKRQAELDRHGVELRALGKRVADADERLTQRRKILAERLRRRRARLAAAQHHHDAAHREDFEQREAELASREAELETALQVADEQLDRAQAERAQLDAARILIDEQATLMAVHAETSEKLCAAREETALELIERLEEVFGQGDRIRELSEQLRDSRSESRELVAASDRASQESRELRAALEAARAHIARLESRVEDMSHDHVLQSQHSLRLTAELEEREALLRAQAERLQRESRRLADDQAACDQALFRLGRQLDRADRAAFERWVDPRTPLPVSAWPIPVVARRRPDLRLVG